MIVLIATLSVAYAEEYAMRETLPVDVRDPLGLRWATTTTTALSRVTWDDEDGAVTWTSQLCAITSTPVFGAATSYPDAFVATTPVRTRSGRLEGDRFTAGPITEAVGDGDDDHDGEPGVTVHISHPYAGEGDVWVRQAATSTWSGVATGDGWAGTVAWEPTQTLYGASTWWLRMALKQRPSEAPGRFELVPITGGCDAVAAAFAEVP